MRNKWFIIVGALIAISFHYTKAMETGIQCCESNEQEFCFVPEKREIDLDKVQSGCTLRGWVDIPPTRWARIQLPELLEVMEEARENRESSKQVINEISYDYLLPIQLPVLQQPDVEYALALVRDNMLSFWIRIVHEGNCAHKGKEIPCKLVLRSPRWMPSRCFDMDLSLYYPAKRIFKNTVYQKIIKPNEYLLWGNRASFSVIADGWTLVNFKLPENLTIPIVVIPQYPKNHMKVNCGNKITYVPNPLDYWRLEITPRPPAVLGTCFEPRRSGSFVPSSLFIKFLCSTTAQRNSLPCQVEEQIGIDLSTVQPGFRAPPCPSVEQIVNLYTSVAKDARNKNHIMQLDPDEMPISSLLVQPLVFVDWLKTFDNLNEKRKPKAKKRRIEET